MDPNMFPTKGNLIRAKNSYALAKQGYELMDKKRNILIRELMELIVEQRISSLRLWRFTPMRIVLCNKQILS